MMRSTKAKHHLLNRLFMSAPALCTLALLFILSPPIHIHAFELLLGTDGSGSFSHHTGRMICRMLDRQADGISCTAVPNPDSVHNLTNIRGGSLDFGIIDSRMLHDAKKKTGDFEFLDISYDNLRAIVPLYEVPVALVVRSDAGISGLNDLKGKRFNAGAPGSLQRLGVESVMKAKNWTKGDFRLFGELPVSQSQDTLAFCHGTVQAIVHIGVHPDASLQQLFKLCGAGLVDMRDGDIQKLVTGHPAFWETDIPAGTYPMHPARVATFGTRAILVAAKELDEDTAYRIIRVISENRNRLQKVHSSLSLFSPEQIRQTEAVVQLHPGTLKYLKEQ